ncbi:lysosome membrane 2-like [Brachionus plicatilis]|uniref:Lysosome membrane 2-like n=1 Tax=Brachionus plicatilis TaxID=10195 RepID=A0A3M7SJ00_BRAPC|nr:lysosome membrane 2-like [Brachionus plicatilis]
MSNRKISCLNFLLLMSGLGLIATAVITYFFSQSMVKKKIHENVIIQNNSSAYKFWSDPPAAIYRKYYLFDVKNPHEIEKGEKPQLEQKGPYVYTEKWEKRHVEFLGPNEIRFTPVVSLKFEPSLSAGLETDKITFLNIPAVGMIEQTARSRFKELGPALVNALLAFLGTKLFETKTAGELISGYKDPLMELAKTFLPNIIKDDKFSLLNGENGTEWQNYTMMTGYDSAENVGKIISWKNVEKLNFWHTDSANLINGTDGTFYPPFLSRNKKIYSFNPDMCRSYHLSYLKDNTIGGVSTYDFHLTPNIFYELENEGFCEGPCLGNGVLNISNCYGGVSGFISQPHFLNADPKFREGLSGLNPNQSIHDFLLHFEPTTSVPLGGNIRLQISFYLLQNDKINLVKNVKPVLFPVVWFDEDLALDADTRNQLKTVAFYVKLVTVIPIIVASIGGFLMTFSIYKILINLNDKKSESSLPRDDLDSPINESSRLVSDNDAKIYS